MNYTRRVFLARAGACGALLLRSGIALADPGAPFSFALASDTHLGRQSGDSKLWAQAVEEINASEAKFTLVCGDLVNNGELAQNEPRYGEWLKIASKLKQPYIAVPGNHDPRELFTKHIHKDLSRTSDLNGIRIISFANARNNLDKDNHDGVVTPDQLKWSEDQLKSAPGKGKNVILLAHVVFHEAKNPDQDWYIKEGREGFSKLLSTYQDRIYAMFSGHHHIGLRGWGDNFGIHEVIIPAVSWNKLRGSAVNGGYNLPEGRRGWVQAFVTAEKVVLKYKPLNAEVKESKEFQPALALK